MFMLTSFKKINYLYLFEFLFYFQSRLKPGRMLLVDTVEKQIIQDVDIKLKIARSRPHSHWIKEQVFFKILYNINKKLN